MQNQPIHRGHQHQAGFILTDGEEGKKWFQDFLRKLDLLPPVSGKDNMVAAHERCTVEAWIHVSHYLRLFLRDWA